jgi:hypothetical protein
VKQVLKALNTASADLKPDKYLVYENRIKYLKYIISNFGIEIDPAKVEAATK